MLQAYEKTPDAANEAKAKKAIADRDTAKAAVPAGNKVLKAFATAIAKQDAYFAAIQKLQAARATSDSSRAKADALKTGSNTTRLQVFVDFVTKESIPPPTAYAKQHWPAEAGRVLRRSVLPLAKRPRLLRQVLPQAQGLVRRRQPPEVR